MSGLARLQLLIDIKDKLNVGLNAARDKVNKAVGSMQRRMNSLRTTTTQAFGTIQDQIPGLGGAIGMLANPYAVVTAAVMALGTAIQTNG